MAKVFKDSANLVDEKIDIMSRNLILISLFVMQVVCFFFNKTAYQYVPDSVDTMTILIMSSYIGLVAINFYLLINLFPLWKNYLKTTHIVFRSIFFVVHFFIAAMVTRFTELFFTI